MAARMTSPPWRPPEHPPTGLMKTHAATVGRHDRPAPDRHGSELKPSGSSMSAVPKRSCGWASGETSVGRCPDNRWPVVTISTPGSPCLHVAWQRLSTRLERKRKSERVDCVRMVHLIRKGVALAGGLNPVGVNFGDWLLREIHALIHEVAEGTGARIISPILARLKRA